MADEPTIIQGEQEPHPKKPEQGSDATIIEPSQTDEVQPAVPVIGRTARLEEINALPPDAFADQPKAGDETVREESPLEQTSLVTPPESLKDATRIQPKEKPSEVTPLKPANVIQEQPRRTPSSHQKQTVNISKPAIPKNKREEVKEPRHSRIIQPETDQEKALKAAAERKTHMVLPPLEEEATEKEEKAPATPSPLPSEPELDKNTGAPPINATDLDGYDWSVEETPEEEAPKQPTPKPSTTVSGDAHPQSAAEPIAGSETLQLPVGSSPPGPVEPTLIESKDDNDPSSHPEAVEPIVDFLPPPLPPEFLKPAEAPKETAPAGGITEIKPSEEVQEIIPPPLPTEIETPEQKVAQPVDPKGETVREPEDLREELGIDGELADLRPGAEFKAYSLLEPLKVSSGEADLWMMKHRVKNEEVVLKLYRYGITPKQEIIDALLTLDSTHVVRLIDAGITNERYYEIQEFIPGGSLVELIAEGNFDDFRARELVKELAMGLKHMHDHGIIHRDVKPSNIFVRTSMPLDIVLADFGISSIAELSLHLTNVNRTAMYCAPEALTGVVAKASDWWSLGVIMVEAMTGQHPFSGMSEQAVNFQLVSKGLPIPKDQPKEWDMLFRGLLTRDHEHRWGYEQVQDWLDGKADIAIAFDFSAGDTSVFERRGYRPYQFAGEGYFELEDLVTAFSNNWDDAERHLHSGTIENWLETEYADQERSILLKEILQDSKLSSRQQVCIMLIALSKEMPLSWEGDVINMDYLRRNPELNYDLMTSTIPYWVGQIRGDKTLKSWQNFRRDVMQELEYTGAPYNRLVAEKLAISDTEQVVKLVTELVSRYAGSNIPQVQALFNKENLEYADGILLLSVDRSCLLSAQDAVKAQEGEELEQLYEHIRSYDIEPNWDLVQHLAYEAEATELEKLYQKRKRYSGCKHLGLQKALQNPNPTVYEKVALVTAPGALFTSTAMNLLSSLSGGKNKGPSSLEIRTGNAPCDTLFTPDGDIMVSALMDRSVIMADLLKGKVIRKLGNHREQIRSIATSPEGARAITGAGNLDYTVREWNLDHEAAPRELTGCTGDVNALAYSWDGSEIIAGGKTTVLVRWTDGMTDGESFYSGHNFTINDIRSSWGSDTFVSSDVHGETCLWQYGTRNPIKRRSEGMPVETVRFSRDDEVIMSCCVRREQFPELKIIYWRTETGEAFNTLNLNDKVKSPEFTFAVSPGMYYALIGEAGVLKLVSLESNEVITSWQAHRGEIMGIKFSRAGYRASTWGEDGTLRIWNLYELVDR